MDACPTELEADMAERFRVNVRNIREEGVAHVAALSCALLTQGTRVAGHFDEAAGWTRREMLLGLIADEINGLIWGLGGCKGRSPESVRPKERQGGDERRMGMSVPVGRLMEIFDIGGE